ncbi:lytic murein transglycosylase [Candidatus Kaiserbacteria bacterium]|nr:lytic murein transglycosylase [Candidatus Kaiserbacteria bacterium]
MLASRLFAGIFVVVLFALPLAAYAITADDRALLQGQLDQLEVEIKQNQAGLGVLQSQRASLERDVAILDSKIKDAQLAIKARDLTIRQLKSGIAEKESGISTLDSKVAAGEASIAQMIRETRQIDDLSLVEIALSGNLQDLMQEVDDFGTIQRALGDSFTKMAAARSDLSARKSALEEQEIEEQDLRQIQVLQRQSLQSIEKEKQDIVKAAKGQESIYEQIIVSKQQTAAQIKTTLFGLRDGAAIPFGTAYQYAKEASQKTGVRPAVILAILREETNLGENIGTGNWRLDMHPTRDQPIFKQLMSELGLDPDRMPVSKKPSYGWGGAMGPGQFIPSTWVLYKNRIGSATGNVPPNPYDARDAIFATALLMADNGGGGQTYATERKAALKYFAGANWSKSAYAFYGNDVMEFAADFQSDIDILEGRS